MRIYEIEFLQRAKDDLIKLKRSGDTSAINKVTKFLEEIKTDPRNGTGKPERLKYYEQETWSRRINDKNRLVYSIYENKILVMILSAYGHYDDK